jgi:chromosome segregation ATPase
MNDKKTYLQKMVDQLNTLDSEIAGLQEKSEHKKEEMKAGYHKIIEDLQSKKEGVRLKLQNLQDATEDSWQSLQSGVDKSWSDFKDAVVAAKAKFKE